MTLGGSGNNLQWLSLSSGKQGSPPQPWGEDESQAWQVLPPAVEALVPV